MIRQWQKLYPEMPKLTRDVIEFDDVGKIPVDVVYTFHFFNDENRCWYKYSKTIRSSNTLVRKNNQVNNILNSAISCTTPIATKCVISVDYRTLPERYGWFLDGVLLLKRYKDGWRSIDYIINEDDDSDLDKYIWEGEF